MIARREGALEDGLGLQNKLEGAWKNKKIVCNLGKTKGKCCLCNKRSWAAGEGMGEQGWGRDVTSLPGMGSSPCSEGQAANHRQGQVNGACRARGEGI